MYKESRLRSIAKSVSWRLWATLTTTVIVFLFIGKIKLAVSIGIIEVALKMGLYFLHERVWDKVNLGRREIKPAIIWLTGLVRSGKSAIASNLVDKLKSIGLKVEHLDGHAIRNLIPSAGFSKHEVNDHIKKIGYLANKLEQQGVFVVASFLSPYEESREFVRKLSKNFIEVYVSTPLEICRERDEKGVYEGAISGAIKNLPGVDVEYEIPKHPDLEINTENTSPAAAAEDIYKYLKKSFT